MTASTIARRIKSSHAQLAKVRAVENGSLLRPSGDGLSLAVDHQGRVLAAADSLTTDKAIFLTSVPSREVATVYAVIGNSVAYLSVLGLAVLAGMALFRRRTRGTLQAVAEPTLAQVRRRTSTKGWTFDAKSLHGSVRGPKFGKAGCER